MKKLKLILIVLCLTLLFGCSQNTVKSDPSVEKTVRLLQDMPAEESVTSNEPDDQMKEATLEDLEEYFSSPEVDVLMKLGNKYEILMIPDEEIVEGIYYSKLGLAFVFDEDDYPDLAGAPLEFIICDKSFSINGASREMNFEQVQEKLGEAKIQKTWYGTPENKVYELTYIIDGFKYRFFSFDEAGTNSYLTIQKAS